MELDLDHLLAAAGVTDTPPAPAPTPVPWSVYAAGENAEEARRAQVREAGLSSGRIRGWTRMTGRQLSRAWSARFGDDTDLARDAALWAAERLIRDKRPMTQKRLFALKGTFLGIHGRTQLDARRQQRGLDALWPQEVIDDDEYRQLPLPMKGLLRLLEYAAWRRARIPACRLRPAR